MELNHTHTSDGKSVVFSIKFIKKNGELVYYPRARKCGLNMHLKANAMRGVEQVTMDGRPFGHRTPVKIWNIVEFNGERVKI